METWDMVKSDREAFADYLATLTPAQWDAPSLCDGWTVKNVTVHLLVTPTVSKGKVFLAFAGAGFNLDKMSQKMVDRMGAELSTDDIVRTTRDSAGSQSVPPGLKPIGILNEVLIHSADVARPLDGSLDLPVDHYVVALDHLKTVGPVLKAKQRIEGLKLTATDADWTTGDGPPVDGPARSLLLAMAGRASAFDDLTGDGVELMRSR
jgi:uncharacterized protein (TIGR03083 family)